ncbi:hypothetical protein [Vibrio tritonius]|uniref:hypothetical protein n=1 Tax=Vibrio tritonius TaxID=1435069 RepID=UPI00315DDEF2
MPLVDAESAIMLNGDISLALNPNGLHQRKQKPTTKQLPKLTRIFQRVQNQTY